MSSVSVTDLGGGVHRVTHPLPFALNHVHCYAVAGSDGWTVIDTGLAQGADERWRDALEQLGNPRVRNIVLTHYHPDHVAGSQALVRLTGAEVLEGRITADRAWHVYLEPGTLEKVGHFLEMHGVPQEEAAETVASESKLLVAPASPARLLDAGDTVVLGDDEFTVLLLQGHADGHIALYDERTGRLFAGDVILERITPNVATWFYTEPDPLGRYLTTLGRLADLAPARVFSGHFQALDDAAGRAREILDHHRVRLDVHEEALREGLVTSYEIAQRVWGTELGLHEFRFAVGEAISHLVRLTRLGRAREVSPGCWAAAA